jgi:FAD/FMN-containing dehydrogenase
MISGFKGIFRTDDDARAVYSEAAGIARIMPRAVAVPVDIDDVCTLVRWAHDTRTPLIPRGSGSSMGGGAIGDGVIVDLSRMCHIGDVDVRQARISVGPGALRADIEAAAQRVGLRFPPDPSSGKFCTIGGMISTNAAGSHTLRFGATRAWVTALDCVFDDGTRAIVRRGAPAPTNVAAINRLVLAQTQLYERDAQAPAVHTLVRKDTSGYDVHAYLRDGDLIDLLIGSEGTLALIVGAELALTPVAGATSSLLGAFATLEDAVIAAGRARDTGAAACELLDRTFLDVAARRLPLPNIPSDTEAALLAEVEGHDANDAARNAQTLAQVFTAANATAVSLALTSVDEHDLWELRHAASPTLATLGPSLQSMQFIEDTAVPPDNLPAYVRGVRAIFHEHGIVGVIFGHAGDAHVHVNPLIDVQQPGWRKQVLRILDQVVTLTASLGGTLAGEHGDGRLRTPLMSRIWPPEAISAFRTVKDAFDPLDIFNPGVKVPLSDQQPLSDIKYDPELPPLPRAAAEALATVARDRAYHAFRLDLVGQAS